MAFTFQQQSWRDPVFTNSGVGRGGAMMKLDLLACFLWEVLQVLIHNRPNRQNRLTKTYMRDVVNDQNLKITPEATSKNNEKESPSMASMGYVFCLSPLGPSQCRQRHENRLCPAGGCQTSGLIWVRKYLVPYYPWNDAAFARMDGNSDNHPLLVRPPAECHAWESCLPLIDG